jgi:hypothetical protein
VLKDAQILLSREECAGGMGQKSSYAALKDARINPNEEDCASRMVQRPNYAVLKDALISLEKEEYALDMVQRVNANDAVMKDVQIEFNEEEYAGDTVHTAFPLMNLQLSHRVSVQILIRLLWLILISALQQLRQARLVYPKRLPSV